MRHGFKISTSFPRLVAEYAGLSIPEVECLDMIDYLILRRDAYIRALSRTRKGEEYLVNAWCYRQTEPDRAALREMMEGGAARGL